MPPTVVIFLKSALASCFKVTGPPVLEFSACQLTPEGHAADGFVPRRQIVVTVIAVSRW